MAGDIVVEVGGYKGVYAEHILASRDPRLYVLEPVPEFFSDLEKKFGSNTNVTLLNYGLGKPGLSSFGLSNAGTGSYADKDKNVSVTLKTFDDFLKEVNLERIDAL